jgi:ATP-dependent Clp protease adaptor protein ClpS
MSKEITFSESAAVGTGLPSFTLTTEAPVKKPETPTRRKVTPEPTYKVILHNDSRNPMDYVVQSLRQVIPKLSQERAISIMLEAHTRGKSVAKRCHKELAEMYEEGLCSRGLTATIEPD